MDEQRSVEVVVRANLDKSLLVEDENGNKVIIPKSQICENSYIHPDSDPGDEGTLVVPEWLAKDRGS